MSQSFAESESSPSKPIPSTFDAACPFNVLEGTFSTKATPAFSTLLIAIAASAKLGGRVPADPLEDEVSIDLFESTVK